MPTTPCPERLWTPSNEGSYNRVKFYTPFVLIYSDIIDIWAPKASQLLETQAIDWVFIFGVLLSLMALLFTFDAFIGEKERGTLKLVMAQSLPRHTLLLGKFLGAMLALAIVLSLSIVVNLLIVLALSKVNLGLVEAGAIGGLWVVYRYSTSPALSGWGCGCRYGAAPRALVWWECYCCGPAGRCSGQPPAAH